MTAATRRTTNCRVPCFRFIEEAKVILPFRNGRCVLDFAVLEGPEAWAWVAQREGEPANHIVLVRKGNMMALHGALMSDGFGVEAGSPAEKLMRAAVKCGHAEELPENEGWRREIILARHARKKGRDSR